MDSTAANSRQADPRSSPVDGGFWMGFAAIVGFNTMGLFLANQLHWRIPGPVLGLLLLWAALSVRKATPDFLSDASAGFLRFLPIIILPAGVGVMRLDVNWRWFLFVVACLVSWCAALLLSAKLSSWIFAVSSSAQES